MTTILIPPTRTRALLVAFICGVSLAIALLLTSEPWFGFVTASAAGNSITVNSTSEAADGADGLCTLREAIIAANMNTASGAVAGECAAGSNAGSDTIDLTGVAGAISLTTALANISSDVALNGPGPGTLTIQRSSSTFTVFTISSNVTAAISGLAIQSNSSPDGAGISNAGNLDLTDCTVNGFGAGILNQSRTVTVKNCVVSGNLNGSGISNSDGTINLIDSVVSGNDSHGGFGPGVNNFFGTLHVTNSTISGNKGHIAVSNGVNATATFINSTVSNNIDGGFINNGTLSMTGGSIIGNTNGGIILAGPSIMNGVTVSNNSSNGGAFIGGGGIFVSGIGRSEDRATIINCLVTNNSTTANGGGIRNGGGKAVIINTTISGNTSFGVGGGIDMVDGGLGNFIGINLTITGNRSNSGGGVFRESGPMKFRNSIIAGNTNLNGTAPNDILSTIDASSSFNLIGSGGSGGLVNGVNNNLVGVADPRLGPLAINGGPTQTHALLSDSPALDAGDNCITEAPHCGEANVPQLTTDQRGAGFNRLVDGPDANATATVDIGAYETQLPLAVLPDTATNEDTQLVVAFDAGDPSTITSITVTSSNPTLVPNDTAHLNAVLSGSTGVITINPALNLFGTTDLTITVNRSGGPEIKTFTLTINSANDAPSFTKGSDQTVNEDAGMQTVDNWATNFSTGPADEAAQTVIFQITANTNGSLFSFGPAISPTGALTYTPAPNAFGVATVTIALKDNGGTATGGTDTSPPQTFVITVNPINDAPSFIKGPDQTVNEDSGGRFVVWASNVSAGAPNELQALTFEVLENTNPGLFSSGPAVGFSGTLGFTPALNAHGSATITIVLKDNGGTANGGVDTSATATFTITVLPVNDRPAFTRGPNQIINEDSGQRTVENWATNISPGPPDEAAQTLTITVTNNNNALFSEQPALSSTGTLTYTPAANASGLATVGITFKDNGGTANGGQDTFSQNFFISVVAVNDPPVNAIPVTQTIVKNSRLVFSATDSNQISISDLDAGNAVVQVTVSASNGLLTLSDVTGLTFSDGNGIANTSMTFTGTINSINAALNGMQFVPANEFVGAAQLQIVTSDLGNTGGGAQSDSDTVNINLVNGNALQFSATSYAVVEGAEVATITVTRIGTGGAASVNYATTDGNANGGATCSAGVDYVSKSGTLSWAAGDVSAKTFTVPVCEDALTESAETVNLTLSGLTGDAALGGPRTVVLTIVDAGPPVLLTEENTDHAIALDSTTFVRDPFSLTNPFNFSADHRRRISLFVWRLALRPTDTAAALVVTAEDNQGTIYPLTVEYAGAISDLSLTSQVVVRLPDDVIGAPRDLKVTIKLRDLSSNQAVIKIAAP